MLEQICYTPAEQAWELFFEMIGYIGIYCAYAEAVFRQRRAPRKWLILALLFGWITWLVARLQRKNGAHSNITGNHTNE